MTALEPLAAPFAVPAAEVRDVRGSDSFTGLGATVADFWRFAMGDLRSNTTRGLLAEFLVQQAVGGSGVREEWAEHDVTAPDGILIEVESAARLQAWAQRRPGSPTFSGLRSRTWVDGVGHAATATHHADVYVFCLHTETDPARYDPLDLGSPVHHRDLADAVRTCRQV